MSTFYDDMSKRDPETTPFTSWILKGPFKAVPKAAIDSQTSIDSMDVDEDDNGKAPLLRESLLLVTQDKLKGGSYDWKNTCLPTLPDLISL
jgi:hypothetical protein